MTTLLQLGVCHIKKARVQIKIVFVVVVVVVVLVVVFEEALVWFIERG